MIEKFKLIKPSTARYRIKKNLERIEKIKRGLNFTDTKTEKYLEGILTKGKSLAYKTTLNRIAKIEKQVFKGEFNLNKYISKKYLKGYSKEVREEILSTTDINWKLKPLYRSEFYFQNYDDIDKLNMYNDTPIKSLSNEQLEEYAEVDDRITKKWRSFAGEKNISLLKED